MFGYNKYLVAFAASMVLLVVSCRIRPLPFHFQREVTHNNGDLFRDLPGLSQAFTIDARLVGFNRVRSCEVYITRLTEKWVESANLVEFALVNDHDPRAVAFDNGTRNKYNVYILVLNTDRESFDTTASTIQQRRPCIFFTEQQNSIGQCIGFGPVYFGILQTSLTRSTGQERTAISFQRLLNMEYEKANNAYRLTSGKSLIRNLGTLTYELDRKPQPASGTTVFNIRKIVLPPESELGGSKRVVIPVDSLIGRGLTLPFEHLSTIPYH